MGFGDLVSSVGSGLEHAAQGVEHAAGSVVDGAAHGLGDGLNAVGLHSAAQGVDEFGEHVADDLGAAVAESKLGESDDPKDLVHGDAGAIGKSAQSLRKFHEGFENAFQALSRLETGDWQGRAAEAFKAKYLEHPRRWADAADACAQAASALDAYAQTVTWAQGQAQQAITQYAAAKKLTDAHNQQVDHYDQQAIAWNRLVSGHQPVPSGAQKPAAPPAQDPGESGRAEAQSVLDAARRQRDQAGEEAAHAVSAAMALAPREPSFLDRMTSDLHDLAEDAPKEYLHFTAGIVKGAAGIVDFARSLNPMDPYNLTHPATYLDGLSTTAAGLVHAADHPTVLLKSLVGSGWSSDPAQALGNLIPNIALTAATDGAGAAETAGADVAENAAERSAVGAGEDAAANGAGNLAAANPAVDSSQAAAFQATDAGAQGSLSQAMSGLDSATPHLGVDGGIDSAPFGAADTQLQSFADPIWEPKLDGGVGADEAPVPQETAVTPAPEVTSLDSAASAAAESGMASAETGLSKIEQALNPHGLDLSPPKEWPTPGSSGAGSVVGDETPTLEQEHEIGLAKISEGARTFPDDEAAIEYGRAYWREIESRLPKDEFDALRGYSREKAPGVTTYHEINGQLRGLADYPESPEVNDAIRNMDQGLARVPIPEDVIVTRGTDLGHLGLETPKDLLRRPVTEQAYTSSSLGGPAAAFSKKDAILHLRVDAGTPGIWMEEPSVYDSTERELLLQRGLTWHAKHVFEDGNQWHIYAEIVPK